MELTQQLTQQQQKNVKTALSVLAVLAHNNVTSLDDHVNIEKSLNKCVFPLGCKRALNYTMSYGYTKEWLQSKLDEYNLELKKGIKKMELTQHERLIDWLKNGDVKKFNRFNNRRIVNEKKTLDLSGANFRGADLIGADLSFMRLKNANLSGANLSGANFRGADLIGADFCGADLSGADFCGADLSGADLSFMRLKNVDFRGADLSGADLSGADLRYISFKKANLKKANFRKAHFENVDFRGADFRGADFLGANTDYYTQKTKF